MSTELEKQKPGTLVKPGIYYDMPESEYHAAPGLSNSGIGKIQISPLYYWNDTLNPDREPEKDTKFMVLGSALHCAVLEPEEQFEARFCEKLTAEAFPGCLVVAADLKEWITANGGKPKGTTKAGWIEQINGMTPNPPPIFDVIEKQYFARNAGKAMLPAEDWRKLGGMVKALKSERPIQKILASGKPEVSIFVNDPDTGVLLKMRLDWWAPEYTLDLKSFSQTVKSIDKTITEAIYYSGYYRQAYFYDFGRRLAFGEDHGRADFVMAFVQSDAPHETRIKRFLPKIGSEVNIYWEKARQECREAIRTYARYMDRYGTDKPWRDPQDVQDVSDLDIKQLAWE